MEKGDQKNPRQNHDDAFLSTLSQAPTYMPFLPDGKYVNSAYDFESHNKNMVAIVENDVLRKTTDYDAIIDPLETRQWIAMGIEAANNAPIERTFNLGVIQV